MFFITGTSCYFPNKPVSNEDMEDFLGLITGKHSKSQACNFETKRYKTTLLCTDKGAENHTYQRRNGCKFNPSTIKKIPTSQIQKSNCCHVQHPVRTKCFPLMHPWYTAC